MGTEGWEGEPKSVVRYTEGALAPFRERKIVEVSRLERKLKSTLRRALGPSGAEGTAGLPPPKGGRRTGSYGVGTQTVVPSTPPK